MNAPFPPAPLVPRSAIADLPNARNLAYPPVPPMFPPLGGLGASPSVPPFRVQVDATTGDLTIAYGTLNGLIPTNIGSPFNAPAGVTRYFNLNGTASSGVMTSCTVSLDAAAPAAIGTSLGFPPNTFSFPLYVIVDRVPFRVVANTSFQAVVFEAFRVQKVMTTPDMLPYDSYYSWRLGDV